LAPQKPIKPTKRKVTKADEVLQDPYESSRPTYIAVGQYKLELSVGTKSVTQDWKVTK